MCSGNVINYVIYHVVLSIHFWRHLIKCTTYFVIISYVKNPPVGKTNIHEFLEDHLVISEACIQGKRGFTTSSLCGVLQKQRKSNVPCMCVCVCVMISACVCVDDGSVCVYDLLL